MERRTFFAQKVKQRTEEDSVEFVVFIADAQDVNLWSGIRRVGEDENGTQRVLKNTRVNAIKRFIESNPDNTIPVSVILAFNPGAATFESLTARLQGCIAGIDFDNGTNGKSDVGTLTFEFDPASEEINKPALIVDGQHRIKGMSSVHGENIPIVIAALINADPQEQAFQFVVINNKAQKVRTDNVKAIIRAINEDALQTRLLQAGVNYGRYPATLGDVDGLEISPFFHLLDWPLNPTENKKIQLTTIETCIRLIRDTFQIIEDDDSQKLIFIWAWKGVKEFYEALWSVNDKFMSKVNIIALNEFIMGKLESAWLEPNSTFDIFNLEQICLYTKGVLDPIPADFWTMEWIYPLQDNAGIRNAIRDDLRKIPQNFRAGRRWNESLKLLPE